MVFPLPGPPQSSVETPFGIPFENSASNPSIPVRMYFSEGFGALKVFLAGFACFLFFIIYIRQDGFKNLLSLVKF